MALPSSLHQDRGRRRRPGVRRAAMVGAGALGSLLMFSSSAIADQGPPDGGNGPLGLVTGLLGETPAASSDPAVIGSFSQPFTEPTINGKKTDQKCVTSKSAPKNDPTYDGLIYDCKPAGVSLNVLPNGQVMYFDGLEGTENIGTSILIEYGHNSANDQSRLLNLNNDPSGHAATWKTPAASDGGANPQGNPSPEYLLPKPLVSDEKYNDGALFCSDNTYLPDGRILANGGTDYYNEPNVHIGNGDFGLVELEGIKQSRIYDPANNSWSQTGSMHYGRWYPTSIETGNGNIFTASGVTKLIKPVYLTHPGDSLTNVEDPETYDIHTGKWSLNGPSAHHSLPLYPRLSLLPDGKVFYGAAGQSFNPVGQSYDEALWNVASVFDPNKKSWQDLGIPGLTDLNGLPTANLGDLVKNAVDTVRQGGIPGGGSGITLPGFRGSTFQMMLPMVPDANGNYTKASYLTAGGVINPPSPGSYLSTSDSRITTVDTAGGHDVMSTKPTGDLPGPRWFPSGVALPTGGVIAFNGSDRDEVVLPGTEIAKRQAEMFDPTTNKWSPLAFSHDSRTYHNAAVLLPDGRVLVGGHAPISTLYLKNITVPGGITAPNDGRDPSFEIYSPPYLSWGARPVITSAPARANDYGQTFQVKVNGNAQDIKTVSLVRNASFTHLVDANQRTVELPVLSRNGNTLTVKAPPNANVAPPGAYMLFVNKASAKGLIPSVSKQMFIGLNSVGTS